MGLNPKMDLKLAILVVAKRGGALKPVPRASGVAMKRLRMLAEGRLTRDKSNLTKVTGATTKTAPDGRSGNQVLNQ